MRRHPGLPAERAGHPAPEALAATRAAVAGLPPPYPPHAGVTVRERVLGGVRCLDVSPAGTPRATLLYLHGGGYRMGDPEAFAGFAGLLADRMTARVVLPDYRLAPEHPFPAALNDALAVLTALQGDPAGPLLLAGDSAGGGLAAATTVAAAGADLPSPRAVILLSPWLDLTIGGTSFETNAARDQFFPRERALDAAALYLQGHAARDPLASPLFADLTGFPPTLLFAGGDEGLLADSTRFAERLALAGTSVEAHLVAGMQHTWPNLFPDLTETRDAVETIVRFVARAIRPRP